MEERLLIAGKRMLVSMARRFGLLENRPENVLFKKKLEPAGKRIVEKKFGTGWKTDYFGHGWFSASFIPFHNTTVLCVKPHLASRARQSLVLGL